MVYTSNAVADSHNGVGQYARPCTSTVDLCGACGNIVTRSEKTILEQ